MEKKEIREKSVKLFLERGYDNTPMFLIAKELGLSKGGLFHHYPTKEALLYEIISELLEDHLVPILEHAEGITNPRDRIMYFLKHYTVLLASDDGGRVALREVRRLETEHYQRIRDIWRRTFDLLSGALAEMRNSGEGKELNTAFSSFAALGMCTWTLYWFDYSRKDSAEALAETLVEIFLKGFLRGG